ncbi:alpha amylase catalytic region [Chloroherpeton thalassium ATCC 35110]|uniref:Alpha amylase catalytic region n=1 Tax=Chloroherpeton thalassium (strain ATCC 35110 / GB-78) TaxID=517418 RepID=B3QV59_CHLT3|nr:alpha-amylase family glycosyl hydrolase [Chloroherpeton thalassium]ACF13013.1 alpha amylase catalytic region [Chloroherpeton thalassium ATCC 35110]
MSNAVKYPLVFEVNAHVWLRELSHKTGSPVSLSTIPHSEIQKWADQNINAVWLMGVWTRSPKGKEVALHHDGLHFDYTKALPGWTENDIDASPYSIVDYKVSPEFGGESALARLRERLAEYNIKLILDFVPNHTALDHPWIASKPEYYVQVSKEAYEKAPDLFFSPNENQFLAYGRDPYFPPWTDTAQLNYANSDCRSAMLATLKEIASQCDGVRCDMAMLMLKEIYNGIWGNLTGKMQEEFWELAIREIKSQYPNFLFIAEAYWDKEWELQQLGFDFIYDKRFYDRLKSGDIQGLKTHLNADMAFQQKLVRFIENHDEERAAVSLKNNHKVAAMVTLTSPGMRLVHQGQQEGFKTKLPVQLANPKQEPQNADIYGFYERLFRVMRQTPVTRGEFHLIDLKEHDNPDVIAFERRNGVKTRHFITVANFSDRPTTLSFNTDAFSNIFSYEHIEVVSTELLCSPQFDISPDSLTVRLRPHEGLLFVTH